jgi:hypothetical protein
MADRGSVAALSVSSGGKSCHRPWKPNGIYGSSLNT